MSLRPALLLPLLASLAMLAACNRSEPEVVDGKPQPILQGSVSDAMIQTDSLQAEAPLEAPEASGVPGEAERSGRTERRRATSQSAEARGEAAEAAPAAEASAPKAPEAAAPKEASTPSSRPSP